MDEFVYHSSSKQNLSKLHPKESTHNQVWLYATKDHVMSALFISGYGGDFTCFIGRDKDTGLPAIVERFDKALEKRYKGITGSIYVLPSDSFNEGETEWEEEVVSRQSIAPVDEIKIQDALSYLLQLEEEGKLIIMRYPQRPDNVPEDDEDLVIKAVVRSLEDDNDKDRILNLLKKHHPSLISRVEDGMKNNRFASLDNLNKLKPQPNRFVRFVNLTLDIFAGLILIGIGINWFMREGILEGVVWSLFGLSLITGSNGARTLFKVEKGKPGLPDVVSMGLALAGIGLFIYWMIRY
jgi:hypothetical protein